MSSNRPNSASGLGGPGNPNSRPTSAVPMYLKEYIFAEKLGSGTYATVYRAFRKNGNRQVVAVKCITRKSLNKNSEDNLVTEIEILKQMRNDYIVELIDFQWDHHYIYLIMEYCGNGDLSRFVRSQRCLSEQLARKFLQQIASALQYLRLHNVSHMDLKPQNILLSSGRNPVVKIGDFGFAQYLRSDEDVSMLRGSPLYMAPEIIVRRLYSPKADLWSLGVILYECLFGRAPFASKTFSELEEKIRDTRPVELPMGANVSEECRDLLLRLLDRDPDKRIEFDDFFTHAFVDLDHMPSAQSLPAAVKVVTKAVEADTNQHYHNAMKLYSQALDHFVAAIRYESEPAKKNALRERAREYMNRAEELKNMQKPKPRHIYRRTDSQLAYDDLVRYSLGDQNLENALKLISVAESKEQEENYEAALKLYQESFESLLKLLKIEPQGRRRELLHVELRRWMSRAEEIKTYIDSREKTEVTEVVRNDADSAIDTEQSELMRDDSRCVVQ